MQQQNSRNIEESILDESSTETAQIEIGQKAPVENKYPLPKLFMKADEVMRGEEVKVTAKDLAYKAIKSCKIERLVPEQKLLILKMGQKTRQFSTYHPIVVDDNIYTCVTKDTKRKLVLFVFVAPYEKLGDVIKDSGAPLSVEQ